MQKTNGDLQKNLQNITTQNSQSLKELGEARLRAKELEASLEKAKDKTSDKTWMFVSAILLIIVLLLFFR